MPVAPSAAPPEFCPEQVTGCLPASRILAAKDAGGILMTVTWPAIAGTPAAAVPRPDEDARVAVLRTRAEELETAFLAEMLGHAGLGASPEGFGGGIGEEQFASFLRREQAEAMTRAGGIGLAESIFRALVARDAG
jgi:peptidoglycan hydrolase FlgJ